MPYPSIAAVAPQLTINQGAGGGLHDNSKWKLTRPDIQTATTQSANGVTLAGTPQIQRTNIGKKGFAPGEIYNMIAEQENANRLMQAQNRQSALDLQSGAYNKSTAASDAIGQQAYDRINQNLRRSEGAATQQLIGRGLGNSTITSAVQRGYQRDAEDARQGVDEQRAARTIGIENNYANQQGQLLTGQQLQNPAASVAANSAYVKQKKNIWGTVGQIGGGIIGGIFGGPAGAAIGSSIGGAAGTALGS
jgi:hypothetical protein